MPTSLRDLHLKAWATKEALDFPLSSANITAVYIGKATLNFIYIVYNTKQGKIVYSYQVDEVIITNFKAECANETGSVGAYVHRVLKPYAHDKRLLKDMMKDSVAISAPASDTPTLEDQRAEMGLPPVRIVKKLPGRTHKKNEW